MRPLLAVARPAERLQVVLGVGPTARPWPDVVKAQVVGGAAANAFESVALVHEVARLVGDRRALVVVCRAPPWTAGNRPLGLPVAALNAVPDATADKLADGPSRVVTESPRSVERDEAAGPVAGRPAARANPERNSAVGSVEDLAGGVERVVYLEPGHQAIHVKRSCRRWWVASHSRNSLTSRVRRPLLQEMCAKRMLDG